MNDMKSRGLEISVVTSKPKERAVEIMNNIFGNNHGIVLVTPDDSHLREETLPRFNLISMLS